MNSGFTYWSDLNRTELSEVEQTQWVHALPVGEYNHPVFGKLSFTKDRIARFVQSVRDKVRGIDPDIDYDHKMDPSKGAKAAGWVKDAEQRDDGLWLLVEWTTEALKSLRTKEYRYFSIEFADEWEDNTGKKYKDVVQGGALTNRPFMKNLVPVNLSEVINDGGNRMDRAELARILGLAEDATEDDIKNKLTALTEDTGEESKIDLTNATVEVGEDGTIKVTHPDAEGEVTYKVEKQQQESEEEEEAELAKLAESNPAVAKMLSEQKSLKDDVRQLQAANRLSEVGAQLSELGAGDNKGLPPVAADKFRNLMVRLPKSLSDEIYAALTELVKVGIVELGEQGKRRPDGRQTEGDAVKQFTDEIEKVRKEDDKLSYRDAVTLVQNNNPQLYSEYLAAVEAGEHLLEEVN